MRVGVVSTDNVQRTLIAEILQPIFGRIEEYDSSHIQNGDLDRTSVHLLIVDFSDDAIADNDDVIEILGRDEPISLLNEVNLHPMSQGQRVAWRNKIVAEARKALPDFANEIRTPEEKRAEHSLHDIWVIGSSSGGPMAVASFLESLPRLPITIVLVQHIALAAFKTFVARIKDASPDWEVLPAEEGIEAKQGQVLCVPQNVYAEVEDGCLKLVPYSSQPSFNPSISASIRSICRSTPGKMGVVIMTGMGDDGAAGIKEINRRAISVLAQSADTCASKSMPEAARDTGLVKYSGNPSELAAELARIYS